MFVKGVSKSEEEKRKISATKKGHTVSPEARKKISLALSGERSHTWKGGITPRKKLLQGSMEYKLWRKAVKDRDGWKCVWCGSIKNLQADHIKPFALFPELRFAIDNGRTLCFECHKTTGTYGKWSKETKVIY